MNQNDITVSCRDLTKFYGHNRGIEGLDLDIFRGEIFGFLGPNGAGKTTTIRLLMGMLRPSRGSASVMGLDCWNDAVAIKRIAGNIPGDTRLYDHLRVHELLDFIDRFHPGPEPLRQELVELFQLDTEKKIKSLSKGNRQKVSIVIASMHNPQLLVLDEPTSGLDPLMQQEFYRLLERLKQQGKTVFLSSHIISEVEHVCDRVGIVRDGRLVDIKLIENMRREKIRHMEVQFGDNPDPEEFLRLEGVAGVEAFNHRLKITVKGDVDALVKQIATHPVEDLTFTQPSLEDYFMSYYGEAGDDD
ncbi:MAG: ABC transporter ATP-binding protein [Thermoleophilia bacterium]